MSKGPLGLRSRHGDCIKPYGGAIKVHGAKIMIHGAVPDPNVHEMFHVKHPLPTHTLRA